MPTREETIEAWQDVLSRTMQCFAFYVWKTQFSQLREEGRDGYAVIMENAAVESTLMSVRDLDSFFRPGRRGDDICADDYTGFCNPGSFLTQDERASINKKLAHLTYMAVRERAAQGPAHNARVWNSADLVTRAVERVLTLMHFLETSYLANDPVWPGQLARTAPVIRTMLNNMNAVARLELEIPE